MSDVFGSREGPLRTDREQGARVDAAVEEQPVAEDSRGGCGRGTPSAGDVGTRRQLPPRRVPPARGVTEQHVRLPKPLSKEKRRTPRSGRSTRVDAVERSGSDGSNNKGEFLLNHPCPFNLQARIPMV